MIIALIRQEFKIFCQPCAFALQFDLVLGNVADGEIQKNRLAATIHGFQIHKLPSEIPREIDKFLSKFFGFLRFILRWKRRFFFQLWLVFLKSWPFWRHHQFEHVQNHFCRITFFYRTTLLYNCYTYFWKRGKWKIDFWRIPSTEFEFLGVR